MKNLLIFLFTVGLYISTYAQNYTKYQMNRATMFSTYIAEKMELNETQQQFIYEVMLARVYNSNATIKSQNLTAQADKQAVYKSEYKKAQEKLATEFGIKEAGKMMNLSNEARKNAEKK
tara:strand:+ start:61 stop:417 length:357 start_codon:yes stop_codon:yes gene_type:complete